MSSLDDPAMEQLLRSLLITIIGDFKSIWDKMKTETKESVLKCEALACFEQCIYLITGNQFHTWNSKSLKTKQARVHSHTT